MSGQFKILLMEDDHLYCVFLRQYVERLGFAVVEAWSLKEFEELLLAEQPDAIIVDVGVPESSDSTSAEYLPLGGMAALDWLSAQRRIRKPKTRIVISSVLPDRIREQFEARGATAVFEKPFDPSRLAKVLERAASNARRALA